MKQPERSSRYFEDLYFVNQHRRATGRRVFSSALSREDLDRHLALIEEHAPYGNDPWHKPERNTARRAK